MREMVGKLALIARGAERLKAEPGDQGKTVPGETKTGRPAGVPVEAKAGRLLSKESTPKNIIPFNEDEFKDF